MSDFTVNIDSTLDLSKAQSQMADFLSQYKNESVKINVELNPKSIDTGKLKLDGNKLTVKPTVDISGINSATQKVKNISAQKIQFKVDTGQTVSDISKIEAKMKSLGNSKYLNTTEFQNAYKTLESFKNVKLDTSNINEYNIALKTCQNYIQAAAADMSTLASESQRVTLKGNIQKTLKENSAYTKDAKEQLQGYINEIDQLGTSMTKLDYTRISNEFKKVNNDMVFQGKTGKNLLEEFGRGLKQISQFAYTYGIIQQVPQLIYKSVSELKEVDSVLTEISKTSDLTESQIKSLGKTAFDSASVYGRTASDYLTGIQEMSRSGFYGKQAEELAKLSILGQAAGDMTADTSNSYLLATNAAYQYQGSVEKLNAVLDGQNMINIMVMPCRKLMAS